MFEKGGWDESEEEGESEDEEEEGEDGWNMEEMRRETERLREEKERERLKGSGGGVNGVVITGEASNSTSSAATRDYTEDDARGGDGGLTNNVDDG